MLVAGTEKSYETKIAKMFDSSPYGIEITNYYCAHFYMKSNNASKHCIMYAFHTNHQRSSQFWDSNYCEKYI